MHYSALREMIRDILWRNGVTDLPLLAEQRLLSELINGISDAGLLRELTWD